jgi:hypothetical protein
MVPFEAGMVAAKGALEAKVVVLGVFGAAKKRGWCQISSRCLYFLPLCVLFNEHPVLAVEARVHGGLGTTSVRPGVHFVQQIVYV